MNKNFKAGKQGGFTLIELIVVIVILGILAATAMPKFVNLGSDARAASARAVNGAIAAASSLVHAQVLVKSTVDGPTTMEGQSLNVLYGYPDVSDAAKASQFATVAGINGTDYDVVTSNANKLVVRVRGAKTPDKCAVTYNNATAANTAPVITIDASDC